MKARTQNKPASGIRGELVDHVRPEPTAEQLAEQRAIAESLHALKVRVYLIRRAGRNRRDLEREMFNGLVKRRGRVIGQRMFDETLRVADFRPKNGFEQRSAEKFDQWVAEIARERGR